MIVEVLSESERVQAFLQGLTALSERYGLWVDGWPSDLPWLEQGEDDRVAEDLRPVWESGGRRAYQVRAIE